MASHLFEVTNASWRLRNGGKRWKYTLAGGSIGDCRCGVKAALGTCKVGKTPLPSPLTRLAGGPGNGECQGIANLQASEGGRRQGQHDGLALGCPDLHLIRRCIDRSHGRLHVTLGISALDVGG